MCFFSPLSFPVASPPPPAFLRRPPPGRRLRVWGKEMAAGGPPPRGGNGPGASSPLSRPEGEGPRGSGRRTMLRGLLCAAPSPEGKRRALQRPGAASVVLPPLLLVVLTACGRRAAGARAGRQREVRAASGGPEGCPGARDRLGWSSWPRASPVTPPPPAAQRAGRCGRESVEGE